MVGNICGWRNGRRINDCALTGGGLGHKAAFYSIDTGMSTYSATSCQNMAIWSYCTRYAEPLPWIWLPEKCQKKVSYLINSVFCRLITCS